jgi:two-component system CheB/CheR fusion protein
LRTALFKAAQSGRSVETRIVQRQEDGKQIFLNITVRPLPQEAGRPGLMLVVFDEVQESMPLLTAESGDSARVLLIAQLEDEIRQLKLHLQDTIEHSETSTEEMKASNEELQAINEELRSATEELETSKEELQSMNEELVTVNYELKVKVEERGHINDDLQNLISSSEIATIFVNRGMHVKRYTPQAARLFNLIPTDLGRSLFDITSRLDYTNWRDDTASAFKDLRAVERHVSSADGRLPGAHPALPHGGGQDRRRHPEFLRHHRPAGGRGTGARRRGAPAHGGRDHARLRDHHHRRRPGSSPTGTAARSASSATPKKRCCSTPIATIFTPEDQAHGIPEQEMRRAAETGRAEDDRWHLRKNGSRFYCSGVMTALEASAGGGFAKIARDMTGTKQLELAQEHRLVKERRPASTRRWPTT